MKLPGAFDEDLFYRRVGEFVITFQWIEDKFRQIGWFMIDPEMVDDPNKELREENNNDLLNRVKILHDDFILRHQINVKDGYQLNFAEVVVKFHELRKFRNNLLHSAYHELKAGGEIKGMLRANPKIKRDPLTKNPIHDFDLIDANDIEQVMKDIAPYAMHLNFYFIQLKHWYWTAVRQKNQTTS